MYHIDYMKRITLLALLFGSSAICMNAQSTITLTGKVEGIKSGRLLLCAQTAENQTDTLGIVPFNSSRFKLKATVAEPIIAQLFIEGYSGGFTFIAQPGASYTALLKDGDGAYIRGGKLQDEWQDFVKISTTQHNKIKTMEERYNTLKSANKFRSASLVNDSLSTLRQETKRQTDEFIARHDDVITAHTYYTNALMAELNATETRQLYNRMGAGAKNTPSARIMLQRIERMEKTSEGEIAPDFTLNSLNGTPVTLSQVPGKIKILDFWASWCGPCRLNNPALKKAYEKYHEKGLEIISVSLDDKQSKWADAVTKDGLPWINVSSLKGWTCDIAKLYNVSSVPAIFILDAQNHIVATNLRGEKLSAFLEEHLK